MEKKFFCLKVLLMLGEVVKCSGVVVFVLYFYESKGLIISICNSGN